MLINYFKIAWRNLVKNKAYSIINIGGLAVGLTVAILISLWIYDELTFDQNHQHHDRIAQVLQHQHVKDGFVTFGALPLPLANEIRNNYGNDLPKVAATETFEQFITYENTVVTRTGKFAEAAFTDIITPQMIAGNANSLTDPAAVLISESLAKTLFGAADGLNKTIKLNNTFTQKVTGIYKDMPANSSFGNMEFIAPVSLLIKSGFSYENWLSSSFEIFALVNERGNFKTVSGKIKDILYLNSKDATKPVLFLNPMSNWHLFEFKNGQQVAGRAQFVWLFGIIDALVLLLACINFMNLNTARSGKRAKEVGIRKTVGSSRRQLVVQFFTECFLVVVFASLVAITVSMMVLPLFSELAGKQLSFPFRESSFWLAGAGFIIITVLLAGSYPALYLSSFKPIKVLKGVFRTGRLAGLSRKSLVVVQFTVSVVLIIGTIQVYRQIEHARNRPIGYDRRGLVTIPMNNDDIFKRYDAFKNELLTANLVSNVSRSSAATTYIGSSANNLEWRGKDPNAQAVFGTILIDPEYAETIKWEIISGRNFSNQLATDSFAFILNESAAKQMGLQNPVGETVKWHGKNWLVIGLAKDMVMTSPFDKNVPTVFLMNDQERSFNVIHVKLKPQEAASKSITQIEKVFKKYCPAVPFEYKFTDNAYAAKFSGEERIGKLATLFTSLAIVICCLGLFGLASYVAEQRTKEIGVRKVLGASVFNIWRMLSKDFVVLVLISCFIAIPVAWYILDGWLAQYEYRSNIAWWIFALSAVGALVITLLTVSFHVIKAAIANPVKSLRTE
jgi:ABC-type antimicrobial peptide transport system permease subunit